MVTTLEGIAQDLPPGRSAPCGRVAIVGLGFAGGALAQLLTQRGYRVTVFEQSPHPGPVGAGILLQPSGRAVLDHLGLQEAYVGAEPIHRLYARTHQGKPLMDLRFSELRPLGVARGQLFQALLSKLQDVELRTGCRVSTFEEDQDGVTVEGERFDWLAICDGSRSSLRHFLGLDGSGWDYAIGALWAVLPSPFPKRELYQVAHGCRQLVGLLPMGNEQTSFFCSVTESEARAVLDGDLSAWKERLLRWAPEMGAALDHLHEREQLLWAHYRHAWLPRWWRGRAVLLGDAAHPMSPHLGQGVNLALVDAMQLARSLDAHSAPQSAFAHFQKARQRPVALMSMLSFALTPFFQSRPDVGQSLARNLGLPLFWRWPWMRQQMEWTVLGLKDSWLGPGVDPDHWVRSTIF